jgi:hypothetical protein
VCVCERERERERKRERQKRKYIRERDRWLEGKKSGFFAYRDVIQITSRLRQRDFGDFLPTDVLTGT